MKRTTRAAPKAPPLYARIRQILESARASAARSVNTTQVMANWLIGREIVEEEQRGHRRAGYGEELIIDLARRLTADYGKGYSKDNLFWFRRFYQGYPGLVDLKFDAVRQISDASPRKSMSKTPGDAPPPIGHAVRDQLAATQIPSEILYAPRGESWQPGVLHPNLSWTHYRTLLRVDKPEARAFYEIEAIKNNWAARELERQINSLLYERLALSRDKKGLMRLAVRGHEVQKSTDVFKDPVVMEFLDLPESPKLAETDLEQALIDNLQVFLLELGKGFAFVARQERLTLDGDHFYIDLVFYHTILKCFVIVELKTGKLMHQDLGQLQLYVNYYDRERRTEGDNPTLGLILCTDKNDTVVRYTLGPDQRKTIFASRYKLHLPTEAELKAELQREVRALSGRARGEGTAMADKAPSTQVLLYQTEDQRTRIDVRLENETVWLSLNQMAELFQRDKSVISRHIRNVFDEAELTREAVVANYAITAADEKTYQVEHFNLDVIISVGYRVKSHRGTQFRIWATQRLREYLIKGFTLDDERLKQVGGGNYFDELLARIRDIRSSEKVFWRKVLDIYATSIDYDPSAEASERFFATVQNKMHWAAHGHTAAEIIADRADATRPTMGLTSWSGGRVRKTDVTIAKNYLTADELDALNRIVTAYLEFAELQAQNRRPMYMQDWIAKLDDFLRLSERDILTHAGRVSHEVAAAKAEGEFEKFQVRQLAQPTEVEKEFEAMVKGLKKLPPKKPTGKKRGKSA